MGRRSFLLAQHGKDHVVAISGCAFRRTDPHEALRALQFERDGFFAGERVQGLHQI